MKTLILYMWSDTNNPFGIFESQEIADKEIERVASTIHSTVERIKLELYIYELPLNEIYNQD